MLRSVWTPPAALRGPPAAASHRLGGWVAALACTAACGAALALGSPGAASVFAAAAVWLVAALLATPLEASAFVVTAALPVYGVGWFELGSAVGLLTLLLATLVAASGVWALAGWRSLLRAPPAWAFVAFAALALASLVLAPRGPVSLELAKRYLARELLLPLALAATLVSLGRARAFVLARRLGLATVAVASVGAVLSVVQVDRGRAYLHPGGRDTLHLAQFVGERAIGLAEAPGTWAAFLLVPLAFALAIFAHSARRGERTATGAALVLIALALALSGLRSGWLAAGLMVALTAVAVGPSLRLRAAALTLALAGGVAAYQSHNFRVFLSGGGTAAPAARGSTAGDVRGPELGRARLGRDESARFRVAITRAELELGRRHPLFGVGLGNIGEALRELPPRFHRPSSGLVPGVPIEKHNVYSGLLAELGAPGLLLFLVLPAAGLWGLVRLRRTVRAGRDRATVEALALALVGTLVVAAFTDADRQVFLWWLLGLSLGLVQASRPPAARAPASRTSSRSPARARC